MFEALGLYVVLAVLTGAAIGWKVKDAGAKGSRWAAAGQPTARTGVASASPGAAAKAQIRAPIAGQPATDGVDPVKGSV